MFERAPAPIHNSLLCALLVFSVIAGACSSTHHLEDSSSGSPPDDIDYTLIYMVHGDANYLYHQNGKAFQADDEALKKAFTIALGATKGEVFIFHQKPERQAFLFFPKKDREYYHYRNGKLVDYGKYSPEDDGFSKEASIYSELSVPAKAKEFFFYFGHQIPLNESDNIDYHISRPGSKFNVSLFADGLNAFSQKFSLVGLSTCKNGNPETLRDLEGLSDVVIASPEDLHLSYLDTNNILMLEDSNSVDPAYLAREISAASFKRLSEEVTTGVTIGIYDLRKITFKNTSYTASNSTDILVPADTNNSILDCGSGSSKGVYFYYKAPMFGRQKDRVLPSYSGWACK